MREAPVVHGARSEGRRTAARRGGRAPSSRRIASRGECGSGRAARRIEIDARRSARTRRIVQRRKAGRRLPTSTPLAHETVTATHERRDPGWAVTGSEVQGDASVDDEAEGRSVPRDHAAEVSTVMVADAKRSRGGTRHASSTPRGRIDFHRAGTNSSAAVPGISERRVRPPSSARRCSRVLQSPVSFRPMIDTKSSTRNTTRSGGIDSSKNATPPTTAPTTPMLTHTG